jgi:hypothetical protein
MNRQLIFRADEELARALAEAARREERTVSAEIRYAVRKHLNERSTQPARPGAPEDVAISQPVNAKV